MKEKISVSEVAEIFGIDMKPQMFSETLHFERQGRHMRHIYKDKKGKRRVSSKALRSINEAKRASLSIQQARSNILGTGLVRRVK